jgi:hypothetical protein
MFIENLREVKIILRTVFENGRSLRDQDFYDDKLTINYGSIQYADEDWYEGIVKVGKEKIVINITGTNIPKDYDDRLGYYIEIRVSEMDFDESELNFHFENIRLINGSFNFSYETMTLN